MDGDEEIKQNADAFAREYKKAIARELTDQTIYPPDAIPMSVFMAGSPGAGKTEFSKALLSLFEGGQQHKVLRIDGDELRVRIPGYTGGNSHLFQGAISILIDKVYDMAHENNQSFILDGTFSKIEKAISNIDRSIHKKRGVIICYVYQNPEVAWRFTQSREAVEGRKIPKDKFIEEFIQSRETVKKVLEKYGDRVGVMIIKKNFQTHEVELADIVNSSAQIDAFLGEGYTQEALEQLLQ